MPTILTPNVGLTRIRASGLAARQLQHIDENFDIIDGSFGAFRADQPYPVKVGSYPRLGHADNSTAFGSSTFMRGQLIYLPTLTVTNLHVIASVNSSGASSSTMGLYRIPDPSTSVNVLVAQSADKGAVEVGTGLLTYALTAPYNAQAGLYFIGFQVTYSTTAPSFIGWANGNNTASNLHPVLTTQATAGPTPAALTITTPTNTFWWVGVS